MTIDIEKLINDNFVFGRYDLTGVMKQLIAGLIPNLYNVSFDGSNIDRVMDSTAL